MQEPSGGNYEVEDQTIFAALNQYFLLFFSVSCVLSSVFIQELFLMARQFHLGIALSPLFGIVLPIYVLTRRFATGFRGQLCIFGLDWRLTSFVVVATLAMVVVVDFVYVFSQMFLPEPEGYIDSLRRIKPDSVVTFALTFIGLCVAVPIAEEIVFRGMIQQVFERNMSAVIAIALAGVFFGAIHFNPQLLLSMTCFGVFLGYIFYVTGNLTYTIISHAVLNLVAFAQLAFFTDENMRESPFYLESTWMLVASVVVIVALLRAIKKGASREAPKTDSRDHFV